MDQNKVLKPEHFSDPTRFTEEQLVPLNKAIDAQTGLGLGRGFFFMLLCFGVGILFSTVVKGGIGYTLSVFAFIAAPAALGLSVSSAAKSVRVEYEKLGISKEEFQRALNNRSNHKVVNEKGEVVTQHISLGTDKTIWYRFTCAKCGKDSGWRSYILSAKDEDNLLAKQYEFEKLTEKKKKYYVNVNGFCPYSLNDMCPHCGYRQRKTQMGLLWPLLSLIPGLFGVMILIPAIVFAFEYEMSVSMFLTGLILFAPCVILFVLYFTKKAKSKAPEYRYDDPNTNSAK